MSRIGKKPIPVPAGVTVDISAEGGSASGGKDSILQVKGPKGELSLALHPKVKVEQKDSEVLVSVGDSENKQQRALWGLFRALINNMIVGVTTGFTKILEINGVGYKAAISGKKLVLNLGYSHPIEMEVPQGLEAKVEKNTITITGSDRQAVGQFAAVVRSHRQPEPYKGKGIKYSDEVIRRKAGKVVKAVGAK
ncbi:MAG: 50S ribosomal protein L6 [Candidatus Doudnabacteria bacterium]